MSCKELIESLRKAGDDKVKAIWQEAVALYAQDPAQAALTWQGIEAVANGLGNANGEILGGLLTSTALNLLVLPTLDFQVSALPATVAVPAAGQVAVRRRDDFGIAHGAARLDDSGDPHIGGVVDAIIMRFVDLMMCFPTFFLILAVILASCNSIAGNTQSPSPSATPP